MQIGEEGLALIKYFETLFLKAYLCPAKVWTIGWGSTKGVYEGMEITEERAKELLKEDVEESEDWVYKLVEPTLNQHEFDAMVSWTFNLGPTNLKSSTLLKRINSNDLGDVPYQMKRWVRAKGKVLKGLVRRRNAEALLWQGKDWRDFDTIKTKVASKDVI